MGWVSYLEDIRDRIESDLGFLQRHLDSPGQNYDWQHEQDVASAVHTLTVKLLDEINKLLEIATDPSVDTAHEINLLREKCKTLENEKSILDNKLSVVMKQADKLSEQVENFRKRVATLERTNSNFSKQLPQMKNALERETSHRKDAETKYELLLAQTSNKPETKSTGIIKMYDSDKKYGFIVVDGTTQNIYFNYREWLGSVTPQKGDKVKFSYSYEKERVRAVNVEKA